MIVYRRFMFRIAEMLAARIRAKALVTGESVGQVASQTLDNMRAIEAVSAIPVLRPLLGMDKKEIVELAKRYSTYEISIRPYQDCCSFMISAHPQTRAKVKDVDTMEKGMDAARMSEDALSGATVFKH
jgi:thiamine biosynthesis protein ThiI